MLRARVAQRLGSFALDAALAAGDRTVLVLVGESGSGKTTLLRLLAGLATPDSGRIEVDGDAWYDGEAKIARPARARSVGYVAQDYALFPHLTAFENVAFGLRAEGVRGNAVRARTHAALERLGLTAFAERRPRELSGGQQQRVAIARAVVLEPRLLLFDEPLSALDASSRRTIRGELRRLLAGLDCTSVYVTHHPAEALAFGETIAVLEHGRVSQSGSRDELMRAPRSAYVAEFLGVNLFRGRMVAGGSRAAALASLLVPHGELLVAADGTGDVTAIVHPKDITLALERPAGTARNVFEGAIEELVPEPPDGALVRVLVASTPRLAAEVTREAVEALALRPGLHVFASFKAAGVAVAAPDVSPAELS
jgi:molybdate transport system ATP-binding protein